MASGDVFFKSNKRTQAGGPSPHLAALKGARICVKEEADPEDKLNIEVIKIITGESLITTRTLHAKEYESFVPTALPILLCNHKPPFDVDDDAILRRIKVVPFRNIYTTCDDPGRPYDANNPRHRPRDTSIRKKLLMEYSQEQLLVWLVQGAVRWHRDGGLGETPQCMKDALEEYCTENNTLKAFIEECCQLSAEYKVSVAEFREAYKGFTGSNIKQNVLAKKMEKRKFTYGQARVEGDNRKVNRKVYHGLRLASCRSVAA
ncbi:hypothetical protein BGX26_003077 [Mortierella sp. AD094]|nr:hypothetical protein BGX26_003077 [Mortierella sp. AD094]